MIMFLFLLVLFLFPFLVMSFSGEMSKWKIPSQGADQEDEGVIVVPMEDVVLETCESRGSKTYAMKLVPYDRMSIKAFKVWFPQNNNKKEDQEDQEEEEEELDIFGDVRQSLEKDPRLTIRLYAHRCGDGGGYEDLLTHPIVITDDMKARELHQFEEYLRPGVTLDADDVLIVQREYNGPDPFENLIKVVMN